MTNYIYAGSAIKGFICKWSQCRFNTTCGRSVHIGTLFQNLCHYEHIYLYLTDRRDINMKHNTDITDSILLNSCEYRPIAIHNHWMTNAKLTCPLFYKATRALLFLITIHGMSTYRFLVQSHDIFFYSRAPTATTIHHTSRLHHVSYQVPPSVESNT